MFAHELNARAQKLLAEQKARAERERQRQEKELIIAERQREREREREEEARRKCLEQLEAEERVGITYVACPTRCGAHLLGSSCLQAFSALTTVHMAA